MRSRGTIFGTAFENKRAWRLFSVERALEETKMDNARYITPVRWRDRRPLRWRDRIAFRVLAATVIVVALIALVLICRHA
jgi:hypothetical protein